MFKKILILVVSIVIIATLKPTEINAQSEESFRMQLESILYSFKNYRFSNISVWQVKDIKDIRKIIKQRDEAESLGDAGGNVSAECLKGADNAILQLIQAEVSNGNNAAGISRTIMGRGLTLPERTQFECIVKYYESLITGGQSKQIQNAYIVSTRKGKEELVPNTIIALIVTFEDKSDIKSNVNGVGPANTFTYPELKEYSLDPKEYKSSNLYGLLENAFMQGAVRDVTLEAQGVGTLIYWFPPKAGVTKTLMAKETEISSKDVQIFKRVSDGSALDIKYKTDELVISPDLISWRKFPNPIVTYEDGFIDSTDPVANRRLPLYGVELKYGLDGINYPSFWSERLTLSAVWEGVKLGIVLPTNGYSSIGKDLFSTERRLTYAGVGLAGEADFPMAVIPKSGIFNANFSYVFGNAKEEFAFKPDVITGGVNINSLDYLVRFNGQLHYTFGVAIDEDYMLRFGLGGTMYVMEKWYNNVVFNEELRENSINFEMLESETIGGVSGKIEFMAKNASTPYGASVQYFDEGLYTNLWLQVPLVENSFSLRFDAKGYFKAFTNTPHKWENKSVFIPMLRFIVFL